LPPPSAGCVVITVNPKGTYLRTNTHPSGGRKADLPSAPTSIAMSALDFGTLPAKNRLVALQSNGMFFAHYDPASGAQFPSSGAIAVFRDSNKNRLQAGPSGTQASVVTPPTLYDSLPTDVPEDFTVPAGISISKGQNYVIVQVPDKAKDIVFSPNDTFFSDNVDPTTIYKLTILTLADELRGAVTFQADRFAMTGTFRPNNGLTLTQVAKLGNFSGFNWQQTVDRLPQPSPYRAATDPTRVLKAPFSDPPKGGYLGDPAAEPAYPFYYGPLALSGATQKEDTQFIFFDSPIDECLSGGSGGPCGGATAPQGEQTYFTTTLVGIDRDSGAPIPLYRASWKTSFNGKSGNASKISGRPVAYLRSRRGASHLLSEELLVGQR
jgi:hypothetical protein